jgi:sulfhydrogenase subunit beta (sulfur reductase)
MMKELIIYRNDIPNLLTKLAEKATLIAPVKRENALLFEHVTSGHEVTLDFSNSTLSVKSALFPQCEKMMTFTTDPKAEDAHIMKDVEPQKHKQVIFGIRPCDAKSFLILDKVFSQDEQVQDPYFSRRKEKTIVVGLGCNRPLSTCFCTSFDDGGPFATEGLDALLTDLGDKYLVDVLTDKGEELLKDRYMLSEADSASIDKAHQIRDVAGVSVNSVIKTDRIKVKDTSELFEDPLWDKLCETCIGCGTCTYICPTCHCFDIQDEVIENKGVRMRIWDSCMFPLYTLQASGHNPRAAKKERFRQRFMHKFKYFQDKFNMISCVGCGRCIRSCPVNVDIRQVVGEMNK